MKKLVKIMSLALLVGVFIAGCSSKPEYVGLNESAQYSTMGLDYHDIESTALKSVDSLLESRAVANLREVKVLAISDIINDTMQKIDVEQLSRKITREMRNSGKFELTLATSGSGASSDRMINTARKLRENDEFDQKGVAEKGTLKAPELSLSGKIVQKNATLGSKEQRTDYYFLLNLTDIKSGIVIWDDEINIIKVGDKSTTW